MSVYRVLSRTTKWCTTKYPQNTQNYSTSNTVTTTHSTTSQPDVPPALSRAVTQCRRLTLHPHTCTQHTKARQSTRSHHFDGPHLYITRAMLLHHTNFPSIQPPYHTTQHHIYHHTTSNFTHISNLQWLAFLTIARVYSQDEKNQVISISLWFRQYWNNPMLTWNTSNYDNISSINVDRSLTWLPDICLYNT